jgi:uncharacterized membrane protein
VIVEERSPSIQTSNEVVVGTNVAEFEGISQYVTLCCYFLTVSYSTEIQRYWKVIKIKMWERKINKAILR